MKKLYIGLITVGALMSACSEETVVDQVFDQTTSGGVLRTLSSNTSLVTSEENPFPDFSVTLEAQDDQNGDLLSRVDMYVTFVDLTPDNGDASTEEILAESFAPSAFSTNSVGLPEIEIVRGLDELASAAGLGANDFQGGDRFRVRFAYVTTDGRVFSDDTASGNIAGGAYFSSPFAYNVNILCTPVVPSGATWTGATQEGAFGVFSTNTGITIDAVNEQGDYDVSDLTGGFYTAFGFNLNQPGTINDFCKTVTIVGTGDATQFNIVDDPDEDGMYDEDTGVLTVAWYDAGNDFEDLTLYTQE